MSRKAYPGDVSDKKWGFVAPCLTLMKEDAPRREFPLRELFNAWRWFVQTGVSRGCCPTTCRRGRRGSNRRCAG